MRISSPLRQRGRSTERWEAWRERTRRIVAARARGRCEVSGAIGQGLDVHHLWGRTPEPWASHPASVVGVTRDIHNRLERELMPTIHREFRLAALRKLAAEFNDSAWLEMNIKEGDTPLDVWRRLTERLNQHYEYDPKLNAIVSK